MSQIMLQKSSVVGFLFLVGIFLHSWIAGIGALLGVVVSTIAAVVLKYDRKQIQDGLYGFNGALVGVAAFSLLVTRLETAILAVACSILSTIIMHYMLEKNLLPYTFPFVMAAWVMYLIVDIILPESILASDLIQAVHLNIIDTISMGFSQVMLQPNIMTGLIFFLALLYSSRRVAIFALLGVIIGTAVAFAFSLPFSNINIGLYGFNGVLCGIAFAGKSKTDFLYASIASAISVLIMHMMISQNFLALTFPFVLATWITLAIQKRMH
ncbi:MAG: urea transporter [Kiritimatiellales bacterium]|nr:urea transporter [Kiritimatiellales bacterium]